MPFTSKPTVPGSLDVNNLSSMNVAAGVSSAMSPALESAYWNSRYTAEELIWTADANRFLMAETAYMPPGSALDIASGEGRNAVWLAERGWIVRGVDFSSVAIEKAKRLAATRKVADEIDFHVADLRSYEPQIHRFDLVSVIYLQVPLAVLKPILLRAAKAVATGGTFVLVAHDSANLEHGYGGPKDPTMLYTAEQVLAALGGELAIEKATAVERVVKTAEGEKVAIDCLVRARRM